MGREPLDQMKAKVASLLSKLIGDLPQPELAKIAFSIKHWADDSCPQDLLYIPRPSREIDLRDHLSMTTGRREVSNPSAEEAMIRWREKAKLELGKTSSERLIKVIMEEVDSMSYQSMTHLSQSLLTLKRRK
jgi:hypothetical protein